MEKHNCDECKISNNCPAKASYKWLCEGKHEEEITDSFDRNKEAIEYTVGSLFKLYPILTLVDTDTFAEVIKIIYQLGYYDGRMFPSIPETFKRSMSND
jgi:hypothetical protein